LACRVGEPRGGAVADAERDGESDADFELDSDRDAFAGRFSESVALP
jgi:hypothetical protein